MQRNAHAQNNYLSRDSTQSHWMPGDSWTRANHLVNSQKIKFFLASECWAFHPHYPPKSVQATLNPHKKWTKGRVFLKHRLFSINSDSQCWKKKKYLTVWCVCFLFSFLFFVLFLGVFLQAITLRHITGRMEVQSPVLTTSRYGGTRVLLTFMVELPCSGAPQSRCKNWPLRDRCFFTYRESVL